MQTVLPDGTYDVIVLEADAVGDDRIRIELTIVAGEHKGEVVAVQAPGGTDSSNLLGIPGTLTVADGTPSLELEP